MNHHPRAVPHLNVALEVSSIFRVGDGDEEGRLATTENSCLTDGMLMPFKLWQVWNNLISKVEYSDEIDNYPAPQRAFNLVLKISTKYF